MLEDMKVEVVRMSYVRLIDSVKGHPVHVRVAKGKSRSNCIKFYDASEEMNVGVYPMMLVGIDRYSKSWLERTFRMTYPPFTVITSEKCLEWIRGQMPAHVHYGNLVVVAKAILKSFAALDKETAMELVESGVASGNNLPLKRMLLRELKK